MRVVAVFCVLLLSACAQTAKPALSPEPSPSASVVKPEAAAVPLDAGFDALAVSLTAHFATVSGEVRVAVVAFEGEETEQKKMGDIVASMLPVYVKVHAPAAKILTRRHLEVILAEQEKQLSEAYDFTKTAAFGQLAGATHLITGQVMPGSGSQLLIAELVDVSTGEAVGLARAGITEDEELKTLLGAAGRRASFKRNEVDGRELQYDAEVGNDPAEEKVKAEADHFADTGRHALAQRRYETLRKIHDGDPSWQDWIDKKVSEIGMRKEAWDARVKIEAGLHEMSGELHRKEHEGQ